LHAGADIAETRFRVLRSVAENASTRALPRISTAVGSFLEKNPNLTMVEAAPLTGRTHQIRVHAATHGFPILGDKLYGGTTAARLALHAAELRLRHPMTGETVTFAAPFEPNSSSWLELRRGAISPDESNAYRLIHGAADGWPGWHVDRHGEYLLSQSERNLSAAQRVELHKMVSELSLAGVYHKLLLRRVQQTTPEEASPQAEFGRLAPAEFVVRENGIRFLISYAEGYSVGLFLDQRENRRRLLTKHIGADFSLGNAEPCEVLNTFAYTCAFSVCAARSGARVTSLDLSRKYLDWGKRNFVLNSLDPAAHHFVYGEVFDWMRRLARKGRGFDMVILDPPTFSHSKQSGAFQVERDYPDLVRSALAVLKRNGVLLACANSAHLRPKEFLQMIEKTIRAGGRNIRQQHYAPQPPDFPITRDEPDYLKTVWFRVE
jgi:23S rRNA (cytosine1962-C5)-methyltransferase